MIPELINELFDRAERLIDETNNIIQGIDHIEYYENNREEFVDIVKRLNGKMSCATQNLIKVLNYIKTHKDYKEVIK